jgi:uncharacterized membrane protein YfcA
MLSLVLLGLVAFVAGIQNALAGGGSFLLFPTLLFNGLDARAANVTSTVALFPGQVTTGLAGRRDVSDLPTLPFRSMVWISLVGGAFGAALLLSTPSEIFTALVPWLVLFATAVFAWGRVRRRARGAEPPVGLVRGGNPVPDLHLRRLFRGRDRHPHARRPHALGTQRA